ncbi:MAG: hypothetical protein E7335_03825 [Clostridiales bacterium]|nr:hypothetical protein [Clostridiales bacterium]
MSGFILKSGDLKARVLVPESYRYTRTRFNHSAFVQDVWYKGVRFTQYERSQPGGFNTTEGSGICCEYNCQQIELDSQPGEMYLKPGIGVLKREEYTWSIVHHVKYEPLPTRYEIVGEDTAIFETDSPKVNGYAYYEKRVVKLDGNKLTKTVTLRNTGDKPFEMEEYGHNFISLGDEAVDENYKLEVPALKDTAGLTNGVLYPVPGGFELEGEPSFSFYVKSSDTVKGEPAWRMTHKTLGWNCCEYTSFDPCRVAIWGDYYVLSCEVFLPIKLAPGEEMTWSRTWEFNV